MKKKIIIVTIVVLIVLCFGLFTGYEFILHEKRQSGEIHMLRSILDENNSEIENLKNETEILNMHVQDLQKENEVLKESSEIIKNQIVTLQGEYDYPEESFNYLAIGNSITIHGKTDFWWDEIGMAASCKDNDYFHLILAHLENEYGEAFGIPINFYTWEMQDHDRDEAFVLLDSYLTQDVDLVTVQLGENIMDLTTFEADFTSLLKHIKTNAPNAEIIVIGDCWESADRDEMKEAAAKEAGVKYVSLEAIKGDDKYFCGMGTTVYDENGNEHIVEHSGVARHPGDLGMKYIADAVEKAME